MIDPAVKRHPLSRRALLALLAPALLVAGCATMPTPRNASDAPYQPGQQGAAAETGCPAAPLSAGADAPALPAEAIALLHLSAAPSHRVLAQALARTPDMLAPGDRVRLMVEGDKDLLTGEYLVPANGRLVVAGSVELAAAGHSRAEVAAQLRAQLIAAGLIRDIADNVHLQLEEAAGVDVSVGGAVFDPGLVSAGERGEAARANTVNHFAGGDFNENRTLTTALRAAGGVRPDAAVARVYVVRGDAYAVVDIAPAFTGGDLIDPQLAAGDRIFVPSAGCFQAALVRPSRVTMPGVRVFISNLSRPTQGNAGSALTKDTTGIPYGTRFLQGLVGANCVGGSMLNAQRHAVLISRNPITGKSVVIQRSVEELVRNANRDDLDPYLMPGDSLVCYDSTAASITDFIALAGGLATQGALAKTLVQ